MGWEASWAMHILIRVAFWWAASQKPVIMVFRRRRKPDIKHKLWRKTFNFWNRHQHCIVPKRKKSKLFTTLEILWIVLTFTSWWLLQLLNLFCATSTKVRRKPSQKLQKNSTNVRRSSTKAPKKLHKSSKKLHKSEKNLHTSRKKSSTKVRRTNQLIPMNFQSINAPRSWFGHFPVFSLLQGDSLI